nr:ribosomal protein S11 [Pyropia sp. Myanmar_A]BED43686.1 ribosomal protein S11 [Pyropia sp. Myanmar_B]BED43710.1 ribosomal protein S11 [Pyropia sp. Myanmar_C]
MGILFLSLSSNNIHFLLTNSAGQIKSWTTVGKLRSKGVRKTLVIPSFEIIRFLEKKTKELNYSFLHLRIKGWGNHKKNIFKLLKQSKLKFVSIIDVTTCPHNGCKISRNRRL